MRIKTDPLGMDPDIFQIQCCLSSTGDHVVTSSKKF